MPENIKNEVNRIDKLDSHQDQKVSLIKGKEEALTDTYIKKVTDLVPKLDGIKDDKLKTEAQDKLLNKLKSINGKNIEAEQDSFNKMIDEWMNATEKENEATKAVELAKMTIENELEVLKILKSTSPQAAYKQAIRLNEKLTKGMNIDLSAFPAIKESFDSYLETASKTLSEISQEIVSQNKDVLQYKKDSYHFYERTKGYIGSLQILFQQMQNGQVPSEKWIAQIREEGAKILNDPFLKSIDSNPGKKFIQELKVFDGKDEFERSLNILSVNFKDSDHMMSLYLEEVVAACTKISTTTGESWKTDMLAAGKTVAITAAATAGAIAMGALFAATGGIAAPGIAALAGSMGMTLGATSAGAIAVAGNVVAGSLMTSLGSTVASRITGAVLEGDASGIDMSSIGFEKKFLKQWGWAALMSGSGQAFGAAAGAGLGRGAAAIAKSSSNGLAQKAAQSVAKYGDKMVSTSFKVGDVPVSGLKARMIHTFKNVSEETGEELLEDGFQKVGQGFASNDPITGFIFSMIPSTMRQSRTSFMKGMKGFQAGQGLSGKITNTGIEFKYTDKESAVAYMKERGAPQGVLTSLENGDAVDVTVNGVRIKVDAEQNSQQIIPGRTLLDDGGTDVSVDEMDLSHIGQSTVRTAEGGPEGKFRPPAFDNEGKFFRQGEAEGVRIPIEKIKSMSRVVFNAKQLNSAEWHSLSIEEVYERITDGVELSSKQKDLVKRKIAQLKDDMELVRQVSEATDKQIWANGVFRYAIGANGSGVSVKLDHLAEVRLGEGQTPTHISIIVSNTDFYRLMGGVRESWDALNPAQQEQLARDTALGVNLDILEYGGAVTVFPRRAIGKPGFDNKIAHEETHYINKLFDVRTESITNRNYKEYYRGSGNYVKYLEATYAEQLSWAKDEITAFLTDPKYRETPELLVRKLTEGNYRGVFEQTYDQLYTDYMAGTINKNQWESLKSRANNMEAEYKTEIYNAIESAKFMMQFEGGHEKLVVTPIEWWGSLALKTYEDYQSNYKSTKAEVAPRSYQEVTDQTTDPDVIKIEATKDESQENVQRKVDEYLAKHNWWLQPKWVEKGTPKEQVTLQTANGDITVYNFGNPLTETQIKELQAVIAIYAQAKIQDPFLKNRYILIDDKGRPNSNDGSEQNGEGAMNDRALTLFPAALQDKPHRVPQATNLEGTVIHEFAHGIPRGVVNDWAQQFGWVHSDEPKDLPGGATTEHKTENPEKCVTEYAKFRPDEDLAESMVAAIKAPETLDPGKLAFIRERILGDTQNIGGVVVERRIGDEILMPELKGPVRFKREEPLGDWGDMDWSIPTGDSEASSDVNHSTISELKSLFEERNYDDTLSFADTEPKIKAKLEFLDGLEIEAEKLSGKYREVALEKIKAERELTLKYLRDSIGNQGLINAGKIKSAINRRDVVASVIQGYKEFQDLRARAEALPEKVKDFIKDKIETQENLSVENNGVRKNLSNLIKRAESNPEAFAFAIENMNHEAITADLGILDVLPEYIEIRKTLEARTTQLIENEALILNHNLLSGKVKDVYSRNGNTSMDRFRVRNLQLIAVFEDLKQYKGLDGKLAESKNEGEVRAIVNTAGFIKTRLENANLSTYIEQIKHFDEHIRPKTKGGHLKGIALTYRNLVMEGTMSTEEFDARLQKFNDAHVAIKVTALEPEGRELFAHNIQTSLDNFLMEEIIRRGVDPAQLKQEVEQEYEKVKSTARITINVNHKALQSIFKKGEFLTYTELGFTDRDAAGVAGPKQHYGERRTKADESLGYSGKFVVGALSSNNGFDEYLGAAPFYGHGVVELNMDKVGDRVKFVEGDSMSAHETIWDVMPDWILAKWNDIESRKVDFEGAIFSKALMDLSLRHLGLTHTNNLYVEAHIEGGVRVEEIKRISYATIGPNQVKVDSIRRIDNIIHERDPSAPHIEITEFNGKIRVREQSDAKGTPSYNSLTNDKGF